MEYCRITDGEHKGTEGTIKEEQGSLYCLIIDGKDLWIPKNQVTKLKCSVINCRTYSDNPNHKYCKECRDKGLVPKDPVKTEIIQETFQDYKKEMIEAATMLSEMPVPIIADLGQQLLESLENNSAEDAAAKNIRIIEQFLQDNKDVIPPQISFIANSLLEGVANKIEDNDFSTPFNPMLEAGLTKQGIAGGFDMTELEKKVSKIEIDVKEKNYFDIVDQTIINEIKQMANKARSHTQQNEISALVKRLMKASGKDTN